ncbi:type I-C CRISPR-associated protein Cas8c/Csd1 [Rhizobium oryzicola]|uniref:Type I-C CRISPR-associated protein Cas8c/Csd1 n=1 Tax=Rhizobium oryzicola TaxID=1232668 RepID=A0ABT8SRU1_9HYPH|nr:type I-C CRISPR-associated protein Cas8c/Csd1 [Rhizobium oryzicola]MDO1581115.1 type I-C CRISPR-associated protein Cas8c/Csd1 [Rhizobium oryzicola]
MTILSSLARAYERLPDAPPFGYSSEKIGFVISLNDDGTVAQMVDWRDGEGKKARPRSMLVPQPVKRTAGIAPNFLWDKTSYVLGVTAAEGKRTAEEHAAFVKKHIEAIADAEDAGLRALALFLQSWRPEHFESPRWPEEMKDQNVVFALESERFKRVFLHDRPAAKALWGRVSGGADAEAEICLVTGEAGPVARLHPSIKGVWGAQSSGAALVSFNLDAFTSYGHEQGDNAPVSEAAAFAYTTALNRFLERDSGHRIQIGDASTVFWADAQDMAAIQIAEAWATVIFDAAETEDPNQARRDEEERLRKDIEIKLKRLVKGDSLKDIEPKLTEGVRFYVLGLAPNAARLSVRFFWEGSFGELAENYRDYMRDIQFQPWPEDKAQPNIKQCALRLAPARIDAAGKVKFDSEQIPKQFSGEYFRSIITGNRFPGAVLGQLLLRIRSDHVLDATRIAMIKAILVRNMRLERRLPTDTAGNQNKDYLMYPDPDDPNIARRLGRLFAVMERAQSASLGENVNATIKDKYLSAASATPAQVFNGLLNLIEHHLSRLRRGHSDAEWVQKAADKNGITKADMAKRLHRKLSADIGRLSASFYETGFPVQHDRDEQGFFMIGYYQERYGKKGAAPEDDSTDVDDIALNETN